VISVVVADDQQLIRSAVCELIDQEPDLQVVAQATTGLEAVAAARAVAPDIVLMDIRMPVMDGIEATGQICGDPALQNVRIVILTTFEEDEYIVDALRAGASGFLGKGTEPGELLRAIRTVHAGERLLSPVATRALIDRYVTRRTGTPPDLDSLRVLTKRELEVLELVGRGMSNSEIAARLFISPTTTKTHVNRTMTKLHAHDRAQLVIVAYESGLVTPSGS
jgi:DNA-binding NarL/FixJ family response regulator